MFVTFQGMGKGKYVQPGQTQHTKSIRDLITWRGNESTDSVSTYPANCPSSRPSSCVLILGLMLTKQSRSMWGQISNFDDDNFGRLRLPRLSAEQFPHLLGINPTKRSTANLGLVSDDWYGRAEEVLRRQHPLRKQHQPLCARRLLVKASLYQRLLFALVPRDFQLCKHCAGVCCEQRQQIIMNPWRKCNLQDSIYVVFVGNLFLWR